MSEVRKWENLKQDCLVNIIKRVGIESLVLDVPFVCKSWHKASLDHSCWQHLDFTLFTQNRSIHTKFCSENVSRFRSVYRVNNLSIGGLIRLMAARGFGKSTCIVLPPGCSSKDLNHISETCHELTSMSFGLRCIYDQSFVPNLINKWKLLEELTISNAHAPTLLKVISEIKENCDKFYGLTIRQSKIGKEVGLAIANHVPKITKLSLQYCDVEKDNLEVIIKGCRDLEFLEVLEYEDRDFWYDEDLNNLASHIKTLNLNLNFGSLFEGFLKNGASINEINRRFHSILTNGNKIIQCVDPNNFYDSLT